MGSDALVLVALWIAVVGGFAQLFSP